MNKKNTDEVFSNISKIFSTGDIRSKYKFEKVLGTGFFGTVRLAAPKDSPQNIVAVKSLLKSKLKKDIKLLENELSIMQRLDHPNIIKFHESYVDHRYVHIVMEYCSGGELFDHIVKKVSFNEQYASWLLRQMVLAIKHLHDQGICHRDLKPENFMMVDKSYSSEVKLIDFGLSK